MVAVKAKFDGSNIEVPPELRQAGPSEVLIVFQEPAGERPTEPRRSAWEVFGKAGVQRSAEEINRQVREERDEWDR